MVIRVMLSHKKNVMAQGIAAHLHLQPGMQLIGVADTAEALLDACGGTLEGVWAATESELAGAIVGGKRRVGPAVARRLLGLLHGAT